MAEAETEWLLISSNRKATSGVKQLRMVESILPTAKLGSGPKAMVVIPSVWDGADEEEWLGPRAKRSLQSVSRAVDWSPFCHYLDTFQLVP